MKANGLNNIPLLRPFQEFVNKEAGSGLLLIFCTIVALVWANSAFGESYASLWQTYLNVGIGEAGINKPLILWVNDGLMAIFFFVVGLEIKRELLSGELSTPRKAALPLMAAIGGAVVPALIYVFLNLGTPEVNGWGVPMATDIAFALGVLALLGSKTPLSLKIFVTALAIVDDLMAVLVIALFYTAKISMVSLAIGFGFLAVTFVINRMGIQKTALFVVLGIATWVAFLKSGVHATIAGVLFAALIPAKAKMDTGQFLEKGEKFIHKVRANIGSPDDQRTAIHYLEGASKKAQTPLERMEHGLHGWVAFGVMPIFALANAGVAIAGDVLGGLMANMVFWGIFAGLLVGKPVGIVALVWVAVKTKIAELPAGVTWRNIVGAGALAGIGFTMALFIANLAFTESQATLEIAKLAILSASLVSGILGWILLSSSAVKPGVEDEDLVVERLEKLNPMALRKEEVLWEAEFNPKVQNYWLLNGGIVLLSSIIGIPLIPIWFIFGKIVTGRYLSRMRCTLTTKNLHVVKGVFVRTEKTVPLDKITDLGLVEGPIMRALGLQAISFETAGQSSAGALVRMTGLQNTESFREAVLAQRDKVVEALTEGRQVSALAPAASEASVLGEIRDVLIRIETLLKRD